MRVRCQRIVAAVLILFLAVGAWAQQRAPDLSSMSVEELMKLEVATVYGASKYVQKVTRAPAWVTIVTAEEIQKYGYRTLGDILRSVPGFYVSYDRNYEYVGIRGFGRPGDYNIRVLLLVDGHRLNDNIYDGAYIGTDSPIDIDLIDHVEIIRGPASSLYGSSAFLGVINVVLKRGRDLKGPETSFETGSFSTYKGRFTYGDRFASGLEMLLSGSVYDSQGPSRLYFPEFDSPATNNGIAVNADDDQYRSLLVDGSFQDFRLQGAYVYREKGVPTASFQTVFNDRRNRTIDQRDFLDLRYEHTFEDQWNILGRLFYDRYKYDGTYVYDYAGAGTPPFTLNKDYCQGQWWGFEFNLSRTLLAKHRVTLGSEFRHNLKADQGNYDQDPFSLYLDDKRSFKNWAFYIQDEFTIRKELILSAGLRYDRYPTFGGTTNPRLALIYNPRPTTAFKLLYAQAFRAPNPYELIYVDNATAKSNPNLGPETIQALELVVEHYFENHYHLAVSGFRNRIEGLISQQVDPADGRIWFQNWPDTRGQGVELALAGKWPSGLEGRLSYTLEGAENEEGDAFLTNSPKHLGKLNLNVPLVRRKLFAGLEGQYVSRRRTPGGGSVGGFFVANATLFGQKLTRSLDLSASIHNLFDKRYADPGAQEHRENGILQDGRNFRLKLTYRF